MKKLQLLAGVRLAVLAACPVLAGCTELGATAENSVGSVRQTPDAPAPAGTREVYFGDLHLHTSFSLDAAAAQTRTTPDDAYLYARGAPVQYLGRTVRRRAPLDFLAVTDHAEYLGNVRQVLAGEIDPPDESWLPLMKDPGGANMFRLFSKAAAGLFGEDTPGLNDPGRVHDNWMETIDAAQRHYRPGRFTSLVGFEYSPTWRSNEAHMHRNVIFRGPDYPAMPFGSIDSMHHESLWAYAENNRKRGIDSLMIPHNTNLSSGMAFALKDSFDRPMTAEYARRRARNEPLVEITQIKGTSETRPEFSPDDEFAGFELLPAKPETDRGSYIRPGLLAGMQAAEEIGVNPFEQGFVGASDFHSGVSSSEEDNFPGGLGASDDQANAAEILATDSPILQAPLANLSASGITGVWADSNTREGIFDALLRRETFATSGPRMRVRIFAGWTEPGGLSSSPDWAERAYRWGVPMGASLGMKPAGSAAPNFIIQAAKDPNSGNLDRVQIVKLWRENGRSFEKVHDVLWSGGRVPGADGKLPSVGNTVDSATASYTNTIGSKELFGTWTDPDFDPRQQALYYARVIEIPTPRWATYLSARSGVALSANTSAWLQERAWTSPIFYSP